MLDQLKLFLAATQTNALFTYIIMICQNLPINIFHQCKSQQIMHTSQDLLHIKFNSLLQADLSFRK